MSEPKLISPLLDGFALGAPVSDHNGIRCCPAIKENSDNKYIVKIISVPASQVQMDGLLLAGAFKDPEGAMNYFKQVAEDVMEEARFLKDLSRLEGFLSYEDWQMEPITRHRLGYEVYLLGSYKRSLEKYVRRNPFTHLEAVNLGLDICSALSICRQAGALYVDLKPGNIFISEKKEFRIGDLGFIRLDALKYTALPEKYHSSYTPPELKDPMASVNLTADTYALGMILYQLYNEGKLPVFEENAEALPSPVNADYELAEIILKAIHPEPEQRWQDPGQMGQALVSYMQRNTVNDVPITPYTPIDTEAQNVQIPQEAMPVQETVSLPQQPLPEPATAVPEEPESAAEETVEEQPEPAEEPAAETAPPEEAESPEPTAEAAAALETASAVEELAFQDEPVYAAAGREISDELSRIFAKADDLISHETPGGVVLPEIPEPPDPFAFATEDSVEAEDLTVPFDPVMEDPGALEQVRKKTEKRFRSTQRKKKAKRFFGNVLLILLLATACAAGLWFYQNIYMQSIDSLQIEGSRDRLVVTIQSEAAESDLVVSCSDNYGNSYTSSVVNGLAEFTDLLPDTMYTITVDIEGFHALVGHTSEVFTTDTSTKIITFTAVTGTEDGSAVLSFTVDGEEPAKWNLIYAADGEESKRKSFTGHSISIDDLSLGKLYTFTLDAGENLSLSGETTVRFMASRLILAENLTATTTNGTDMTIRWTSPGDTVVESWNVRCYNENGYERTVSVPDTEVYLTDIDPTVSYTVEVTAAGMTQPARTSITANPINITALQVDDSDADQLNIQWEYTGEAPEGGWLFMYRIDGNADLNVVKCSSPSASVSPKIPEANYQFTIQTVVGTSVFDNVHDYTCPAAPGYDSNGVTQADITAYLLKTPEDSDWSYDRVGSDSFTDQFAVGDPISVVLHGNKDFYLPGTDVKMLYVIRDAHGFVIPDLVSNADENWRSIWYTGNYHYGELDLPVVPDSAGTYQLSIYLDGAFLAEASFTIS